MNQEVYILSKGRAGRVRTLDAFPDTYPLFVAVEREEYADYARSLKDRENVTVIPHDGKLMGGTRQAVLDQADARYVILLDDDLHFQVRRRPDHPTYLRKTEPIEAVEMMGLLFGWLGNGIAHVSLSAREGHGFLADVPYAENKRCMRVLGYDRDILQKEGIRHDRLATMDDFDVNLFLLRAGYKNRVSYLFASAQGRSNEAGGCSTWRTAAVQEECARAVVEAHRPFASLVKRKTNNWDGEGMSDRYDVRCYWEKAYASSQG